MRETCTISFFDSRSDDLLGVEIARSFRSFLLEKCYSDCYMKHGLDSIAAASESAVPLIIAEKHQHLIFFIFSHSSLTVL